MSQNTNTPPTERLTTSGVTFDYNELDATVAAEARAAASRIRQRHRKAAIETGSDLMAIKHRLGHGNFLRWIEAEFKWDERTARRYMQAAKVLGGKSDIVSDLPATAIYALSAASTPEPIRAEVIKRLEDGDSIKGQDIKEMVRKGRARPSPHASAHPRPPAGDREPLRKPQSSLPSASGCACQPCSN